MQSGKARACSVVLLLLTLAACLAAGCFGDAQKPRVHILVMKTDTAGNIVWKTPVSTGYGDYATAVAGTPDGGYAVAGTVTARQGAGNNPRIIRLGPDGTILWDRTLDGADAYSVAIAPAGDGGFVVAENLNNYNDGAIVRTDAGGTVIWNRSFAIAFTGIVPAGNGTFVLAGSRTALVADNGTLLWDVPVASSIVLPAVDSGFIAARYGPQSTGTDILRLDRNGTLLWDRVVTLVQEGKIGSLNTNPDGMIEAVATWWNPAKDRDMVWYIESERLLLSRDGNITGRQPVPAAGPMVRTPDGGYTFLAYAFPGGGSYTTLPHADSTVHLVHCARNGTIAWDRANDLGGWTALQQVLPAGDGGFVALIVTGQ